MSLPSTRNPTQMDDTWGDPPILINFESLLPMTPERFYEFACENSDLVLEQNQDGTILIFPHNGGLTSIRSSELCFQLAKWSKNDSSGVAFLNALFRLPNGAARCANVSWVRKTIWDKFTKDEREGFTPLCPDFVIELRDRSDRLCDLKHKMDEYAKNGVQLGWLIDPYNRTVHIYRPNILPEVLDNPTSVSGENVLEDFVLQVAEVFDEQ
jgi:Uma2 family endonuclease